MNLFLLMIFRSVNVHLNSSDGVKKESQDTSTQYQIHSAWDFRCFQRRSILRYYGDNWTGTAQKFIHFLRKVLKQRMKTISLEMRRFFIILDNASIHKTREVLKFVSDSKIRVLTIPPYEPSLNPVEKFILTLKSKLRQKKQRGQ